MAREGQERVLGASRPSPLPPSTQLGDFILSCVSPGSWTLFFDLKGDLVDEVELGNSSRKGT